MKKEYWLVIIALAVSYAAGRYMAPVKIETKVVEVEKKQTETERDKHKETTTVVTERPDGSKVTETRTTEDTNTQRSTKSTTDTTSESVIKYASSRTTLQGIASYSPGSSGVAYGGSVSRNLLGPIVGGGFVLTNGTFGVSLGLEF